MIEMSRFQRKKLVLIVLELLYYDTVDMTYVIREDFDGCVQALHAEYTQNYETMQTVLQYLEDRCSVSACLSFIAIRGSFYFVAVN